MEQWEKLKAYFIDNLSNGILLSSNELLKYCKQRKWNLIDTSKIRRIRRYFKFVALFEPLRRKPKFCSVGILRYGLIFGDIGFINQFKNSNNGYGAFLALKEVVSGQINAVEVKTKSIKDVYEALQKLISSGPFSFCHSLVFDRERSIVSKKFQSRLYKEYGIRIFFLKNRSKSFMGEVAVKYVKQQISMKQQASGNNRWIGRVLANIVTHYNSQKVPGTSYVRGNITRKNTLKFLAQKFKMKNPSLLFNSATLSNSSFTNKRWRNRLFRFKKGDKVLIARKVNYLDKPVRLNRSSSTTTNKDLPYTRAIPSKIISSRIFEKATLKGNYSSIIYTIEKSFLKSNSKFFWSVVYTLKETNDSIWYQK